MKAFRLRIAVSAVIFVAPCFGWLHLSNVDAKEFDSPGQSRQAADVDLARQRETVGRAIQQGAVEIQSRAIRPPYPPEPVEFAKFREGPYWGFRKKVGQIWYLLASPRFTKASDFIDGKASVEWRELVTYPKMRGYASPAEKCFNWFGTLLADGSLTDTRSTVVFTNYYTQLNPVSRDCLPN